MICTFFGHKNTPGEVKEDLKSAIKKLVNLGVTDFYVGNNGNFDFLVQKTLKELSSNMNFNYAIILSRLDEQAISDDQKSTVFPEGLENAIPRFAISKRNEWMIRRSDFVITYTKSHFSNCYKWIEKAEKRGINIINLAK